MEKIMVIGSGTMGNGIAHVFAQTGYKVTLVDINDEALDRAFATIEKNLDRQLSKGSITEDQKKSTLANIERSTNLKNDAHQMDLVVEAATENASLKLDLFKTL